MALTQLAIFSWILMAPVFGRDAGAAQAGETVRAQSAGAATGSIRGVLRDPTGAVVAHAKVEVKSLASAATWTHETDAKGRFLFAGLQPGHYQVTIIVPGFEVMVIRDVVVAAGHETVLDVTLKIPR